MKLLRVLLACCAVVLASGCASIVSGGNQSLSVTARNNAGEVAGAECELKNDKGVWYVKTPGSTMVHRSYEDLQIRCEKPGMDTGMVSAKSSTKGMAFGNILFGGIIGAGVDMASGAAYDYPPTVAVEMGKSLIVTPPDAPQATSSDSSPPAAPSAPRPVVASSPPKDSLTQPTTEASATKN